MVYIYVSIFPTIQYSTITDKAQGWCCETASNLMSASSIVTINLIGCCHSSLRKPVVLLWKKRKISYRKDLWDWCRASHQISWQESKSKLPAKVHFERYARHLTIIRDFNTLRCTTPFNFACVPSVLERLNASGKAMFCIQCDPDILFRLFFCLHFFHQSRMFMMIRVPVWT